MQLFFTFYASPNKIMPVKTGLHVPLVFTASLMYTSYTDTDS